ncbi:tetratricopeptide repeat protein [Flavobacteriaceae bacterium]|nr:tetratricopeptide repeat protein [Flavobacteriaceae bacterium]MDC0506857.1 tetratricopeptide repeat protein [Flavobacteriaceae bacterium]
MNRIILILLFFFIKVNSQEIAINKDSNNLTLDGNVEFADKNLIEAEKFYRKSISKDSLNIKASYNLANSFYRSELKQEAINQYKSSIEKTKSKETRHKSFHNLGNIYMQNEDYQNAVNSFKNALLNNPTDDETRYNYALAKELLKNEQKDNKKDDNDKKDDKDKKKDKDKDKKDDQKEKKDKQKEKDKKDDKNNDKKEKPKPNKISPEQLKNLLKAMDNQEKKVQQKINKKKIKGSPVKNKKDW